MTKSIYLHIQPFLPLFDTLFLILFFSAFSFLAVFFPWPPTNFIHTGGGKRKGIPDQHCYYTLKLLDIPCMHDLILYLFRRAKAVVYAIHCVASKSLFRLPFSVLITNICTSGRPTRRLSLSKFKKTIRFYREL